MRLDSDVAEAWPAYRLWLAGRVSLSELDGFSIEDVDAANRALDAWEEPAS